MRRCPACSTPLYHQKVNASFRGAPAFAVEACAGCAGTWLDDGKLSALGQNPTALRRLAADVRASEPPLKPERTEKCPVDGQPLSRVEYPAFPGVSLLGCGACRGVFAETGVLGSLAARLAPAAPANAMADGGVLEPAVAMPRYAADDTATDGLPLVRAVQVPYTPPSGFFDRLSRGFAFLKAAYAMGFEKPALLMPTIVGGLVSLVFSAAMLAAIFGFFVATGGNLHTNADAWAHAHRIALVLSGLVWGFCAYTISYSFMGMTVSMVDAWLKGREPSFGTAARDVMKNLLGIVQLAVASVIVSIVIGMVRGDRSSRRGIAGMIVGSIREAIAKALEEAWTVLTFLLLPVIMIEDVALPQALSRVRSIHRGNILQIAIGELGIHLAQRAIGFVVLLLMVGVGAMTIPLGTGGVIAFAVILVATLCVVGAFQTFVRGAYYTCIYLWAVEKERRGASAMVPALLAPAFG